jgi:hypothetical protein
MTDPIPFLFEVERDAACEIYFILDQQLCAVSRRSLDISGFLAGDEYVERCNRPLLAGHCNFSTMLADN